VIRYDFINRFGIRRFFGHDPSNDFFLALDVTVLVYTFGIALKMASSARMEIILREEEKQLIHARLTTLKNQINPHFLFNTLNSISVLIRTDAEKAREMTRKLSSIFRKSLEDSSDTHALNEELKFIDDYLSIEKVRFGDEKLRIVREIEQDTLDIEVPSMILQPLVENAIKHGVSRMKAGGIIRITSKSMRNGVEIEIESDGPQSGPFELEELLPMGMGLRNVIERLKIYTLGEGRFSISSREGGGAVVSLFIPYFDEGRKTVADQGIDRR
jgi:two-component system LytT family sensor kinase